jgi:hypothetical protein
LKLLYFDPELHFVHVSIVEFERREKKKKLLEMVKERESDQLARFHEQKKPSLVSMCSY